MLCLLRAPLGSLGTHLRLWTWRWIFSSPHPTISLLQRWDFLLIFVHTLLQIQILSVQYLILHFVPCTSFYMLWSVNQNFSPPHVFLYSLYSIFLTHSSYTSVSPLWLFLSHIPLETLETFQLLVQSIIWHLSSSSIKKLFLLLCHQQATTQDKNYLICRKSEMLQETPLCLTELSIDIRLTSQTKSRTQDKACLLSTGSTQSFFNTFALSCRRRQGYSPVTHELWLSHHIWKALCWWGGVLQHSACHIRQHYLTDTLSPIWLELLLQRETDTNTLSFLAQSNKDK